MKNICTLAVLMFIGVIFTGCSSNPSMKQIAEDNAKASQVREQAAQDRRDQDQKRMESSLSKIPSWALEPPHPDSSGIYAIGMGDSDVLSVSLKKAMLNAEFGLAKLYGQELSGSERSYVKDDGGRTSGAQYTELIDKLVAQVPVVGFEVVRQDIKVIDGKYNAFVLVKLPYDQFNAVIKQQSSKVKDATVADEFKELERRVEKRQRERADQASTSVKPVVAPSNAGAPLDKGTASVATATASASATDSAE